LGIFAVLRPFAHNVLRGLNRYPLELRKSDWTFTPKVSRLAMHDRRNGRPRQILVSLVCVCALGYFAFHAIKGRHGLEVRNRLLERSHVLEPEIARLEAVRTRLERDVRLLDARDPDIVEELAGDFLGFARPGDKVLIFSGGKEIRAPAQAEEPARR